MKTTQFSNLDLETQKKIVLEHKLRPIIEGYEEIDFDPLLESFTYKLGSIGFNVKTEDIKWSGFGSQGDGLSFTGTIDINKFLKTIFKIDEVTRANGEQFEGVMGNLNDIEHFKPLVDIDATVDIIRNTSRYVHEKTCQLEYDPELAGEFGGEEMLGDLMAFLEAMRYELCVHMFSDLKDHHDEITGYDYHIEILKEENKWWTLDGKACFDDKVYPVYDYDITLDHDAILKHNLTMIEIDEIVKNETDIRTLLNILEELDPNDDKNLFLFNDGRIRIYNRLRMIESLYHRENEELIVLPHQDVNGEDVYDRAMKEEILIDTWISSVRFSADSVNDVAKILEESGHDYDFEDTFENNTYCVVYVYSIMKYLDALKTIHKINRELGVKDVE